MKDIYIRISAVVANHIKSFPQNKRAAVYDALDALLEKRNECYHFLESGSEITNAVPPKLSFVIANPSYL